MRSRVEIITLQIRSFHGASQWLSGLPEGNALLLGAGHPEEALATKLDGPRARRNWGYRKNATAASHIGSGRGFAAGSRSATLRIAGLAAINRRVPLFSHETCPTVLLTPASSHARLPKGHRYTRTLAGMRIIRATPPAPSATPWDLLRRRFAAVPP